MEDLRGQHLVVTGATGGLGPSVVETLLACGANVTAVSLHRTDLDALRADMRQHDRLNVAECDVTDSNGVERLFDALDAGTGPVAGVVHAVGGFSYGPLVETTDATIELLNRLLFLSPILVARAAVRRMLPRKSGRIVIIGGLASLRPTPKIAVYGAMKAAVGHFVQSLAAEVGATGITVNAVLPGTIDTPANRKSMPKTDPANWVAPGTIAKSVMMLFGEAGAGINGALIAIPDRV